MKTPLLILALSLLSLTACATPRRGPVDVGFTRQMVFNALGEPQRKYARSTESERTEIWAYTFYIPGFEVTRAVAIGGSPNNEGIRDDERTRLVFKDDKLVRIEDRSTKP